MSGELIELPEGWDHTKIREVIEIIDYRGRTPPFSEEGIPHLRSSNIKNGKIVWEDLKYVSEVTYQAYMTRGFPHKGDILFTTEAPLGEVALAPEQKFSLAQRMMLLRPNEKLLEPKFLLYQIKSSEFQSKLGISGTGSTVTGVSSRNFQPLELVIAPLNEQKRIVAKIEELNDRTQRAKEALEAIPQLCERFRQSVLAAAFRGDLTADWRELNPDVEPASVLLERIRSDRRCRWEETELEKMKASVQLPKNNRWKEKYIEPEPIDISNLPELPQGWGWANMDEIADIDLGKMLDRGKEQKGKFFPYLRNINVRWGYFDLSDLLEMDFVEDEIERFSLKKDDIIVCEGGEPGRAAVWQLNESNIKYQKTLHRVRPFCKISPFWFVYHLRLDATSGNLENYFSGSTIKHFTKAAFQKYAIRLTSIEEQTEIILRIHSLFQATEIIQQQYQKAKAKLEQLNQSILAKAFRGELVPQDPDDEPASVLLERIRAEREKLNNSNKKSQAAGKRRSKTVEGQGVLPGFE
ncbi:hypothetical protein GS682_05550 [Nostoc sp. B(2019)]|nr:hypothetical protein [Nostoc sp. B(2019)]